MSRQPDGDHRLAAALASLAGPQGPWASREQTDRLRREVVAGDPVDAARRILAVMADRPALPGRAPVTWQDVEGEAAEVLSELGEHAEVRALLTRSVRDPAVRLVAIRALANLAAPDTAAALAALAADEVHEPVLTEEELVYLASALGSVGGDEARAAVEALSRGAWPAAVTRELEIALQTLGPP